MFRKITAESDAEAIQIANDFFIRPDDSVHMEKENGDYDLLEKIQVNGTWLFLTEEHRETLERLAVQVDDNWIVDERTVDMSPNEIECLEESVMNVIDAFNAIPIDLKRRNSLTVLAQRFNGYERMCLELANQGVSSSLEPGTRVIFIETKEKGTVSSVNENFVFVKFDHLIPDTGIDDTTGQACSRDQLMILE